MLRGLGFRNALVRIGHVRLLLLLWVVDGLLVRLLRRSLLKALGRIIITSRLPTHRCIPVRQKIRKQEEGRKQESGIPALVGAAGIPLSPARSKSPGAVQITVSAPSPNDNNPQPRSQSQPPTILATTPTASNFTSTESALLAPTPRTSTLPLTDSDDPLASLDLSTKTLCISSGAFIAIIPSLYAIDSVVAGVLAVAVADEGSRGVLMGMEMGTGIGTCQSQSENAGLELVSTAEREDVMLGSDLVERVKSGPNPGTVDDNDNDKREPSSDTPKPSFWDWLRKPQPREPKPKKQKNKQIVIEEFDLEKYGRYGPSSSREGEKLPAIARGVLRVLFWGLNLMVRLLTAMVKVLAWVLVNLTRCVTSERF